MTDAIRFDETANVRQGDGETLLRKRHRAERRFKLYGIAAILVAVAALALLAATIIAKGYTAFVQTEVKLQITLDPAVVDPDGTRDPAAFRAANYTKLVRQALRAQFPDVAGRRDKRALGRLLSTGAGDKVRDLVLADPSLIGTTRPIWVLMSDDVDQVVKGHMDRRAAAKGRRFSDAQLAWLEALEKRGLVALNFNTGLFTGGDSREPEMAGIWGAVVGSFYTLAVTLALSFPIGVAAAVYLEEFAAKNRLTRLIEVNINNLAAVPSIVFGLLGLAIFLNVFHLPRSAPLVGGMTLALMTLPVMIIAARAALRAVPPSIREGALALGASRMQVVWHHVLPLAMPGTLTGTIIGLAGALGETAPLLMIGMVAFIVDVPGGPLDPATVLPVQVYLWSDSPERAFVEKSSAAILVLLGFLILMNAVAVFLRQKFERRW